MTAKTEDILKENLDETMVACIGKTSDEMTLYEQKKWMKKHLNEWRGKTYVLANTDGASEAEIRAQLVANALTRVGDLYDQEWREKPGYADCSSLVFWIYEETIPQAKKDRSFRNSSGDQGVFCHNAGVHTTDLNSLEAGDLIFWALKDDKNFRPNQFHISHVGMVISNDGNGNFQVIEASSTKGRVILADRVRNKKDFVFGAKPVLLYTGEKIIQVPDSLKAMDKYGVLSPTEYLEDKILKEEDLFVYYYCDCEYCRSSRVSDMTGMPREEGDMAISNAFQMNYCTGSGCISTVGDEMGSVFCVDGVCYKVRDYSEGRFALNLDTVGIYIADNGMCESRIPYSDRVTCDGIDPDETFICDHLAALYFSYYHQITTSLDSYAVRSIDADYLQPLSTAMYRYSGNLENDFIDTGGN